MTAQEKINVRTIVRAAVIAITTQAVIGIVVGFGILNKDHFKIKSHNEKILEMQHDLKYKLSYDAFNQFMKFKKEENDLLRQMVAELKNDNKEECDRLQTQLTDLQRRIDKLFIEFGIGAVRSPFDKSQDTTYYTPQDYSRKMSGQSQFWDWYKTKI